MFGENVKKIQYFSTIFSQNDYRVPKKCLQVFKSRMAFYLCIYGTHYLMFLLGSLILVATGRGSGYRDSSQVVDVSSTKSCASLTPYPLKMGYATGGVLNGSSLLCGGYAHGQSYYRQSSCYIHQKSSNNWRLLTNMNSARYHHASAMTNGGLWITGGYSSSKLSSTEFVFSNGSTVNGPNLPSGRYEHCMVTLDNGNIMILGGYPSSNYKNVLIFNPKDNTFTTGPSLLYNRFEFGCVLFMSPMHNNRPVVLAAGGTNTAEILDYTHANAWEQSKHIYPFTIGKSFKLIIISFISVGSLPTIYDSFFYGATALPSLSGDGAYLQYKQYFYELRCSSTSCQWSIMKQKLKNPVRFAVMMYLPYGYTC